MGFKPTAEQTRPAEFVKTGKDFLIEAFAGTGKTTTLNLIANSNFDKNILYVTFGKENIREARRKFPSNVTCSTAHSLAYQFVNQRIKMSAKQLLVNSISLDDISSSLNLDYFQFGTRELTIIVMTIAKNIITAFCKSTQYQMSPSLLKDRAFIDRGYLDESGDINEHVSMGYSIACEYWDQVAQGKARLTHDMYLKLWQISDPVLNYDLILFDEAQDADMLMVHVISRQSAQKVIVGDTHQQIYSFRGAVNALDHFKSSGESLRLTKAFRYGSEVAQLANQVLFNFKGIKAGIIGNEALDTRVERYDMDHDIIIGRNMQSLFSTMVDFTECGYHDFTCLTDTRIMLDIIYGIIALKKGNVPKNAFLRSFENYRQFEVYCDHAVGEMIPTYYRVLKDHGPKKVIGLLKTIGSKRNAKTILMTAHKCKGLEFDYVTLMDDFPNLNEPQDFDDLVTLNEEVNLQYVAATRGMKGVNISRCESLMKINSNVNSQDGANIQ